jgi:hypothetical protein
MVANPCNDTMTNISTVPLFHRDLPVSYKRDHDTSIPDLSELLSRVSKRAYEKQINSESGRQTLAKAVRYNIPFDSDDIDFLDLMDKITEYEHLLKRAAELAVDWDESNYDIAELKEELEIAASDPERDLKNDYRELRRDYYASIAL